MKLRNKKTGEIVKVNNLNAFVHTDEETKIYYSLAELNEEWEDYEEPETYYYISDCTNIESLTNDHGHNLPEEIWESAIKRRKEIGNYFESKEEAEKAVEKLKAWKRLKDKGAKFEGWKRDERYCGDYTIKMTDQSTCDDKDLDLLFGGEDEI